jgi:hypothetical protein
VSHNVRADVGQDAHPTSRPDADPLDIPEFLKVESRTAGAKSCAPSAFVESSKKPDCRPLHVLVPLIKYDLERGDEASRQAGLPYYRAAGQKMLEAKAQLRHGEFQPWLKRNFNISPRQCRLYMGLAETNNGSALPFASLSDFVRKTSNPNYNKYQWTIRPQREPLAELTARAAEREAKRKLALQLIDAGYKVLAMELHPDRGGSQEAMVRLNDVRAELRAQIGCAKMPRGRR